MMVASVWRRAVVLLLFTASLAMVVGCGGEESKISVLPDQGKAVLPKAPPTDLKPQKGMDRVGSEALSP